MRPLEIKRFGDDRNRESARLFGDFGDDGRGAGSGAAAHASGHENQVGFGDGIDDFVARFLGAAMADFGIAARAQTRRDARPDLNLLFGLRSVERLFVGVNDDKFNAGQTGFDHAVDRVGAAASNTDDFDDGLPTGSRKCHSCNFSCSLHSYWISPFT